MAIMIDRRCPKCNRPVKGKQEVARVSCTSGDSRTWSCPHCKTPIRLSFRPCSLGALYFVVFERPKQVQV